MLCSDWLLPVGVEQGEEDRKKVRQEKVRMGDNCSNILNSSTFACSLRSPLAARRRSSLTLPPLRLTSTIYVPMCSDRMQLFLRTFPLPRPTTRKTERMDGCKNLRTNSGEGTLRVITRGAIIKLEGMSLDGCSYTTKL